jgi:hypothetical protein
MNEKKHLTYEGSVIEHLSNDEEISIKDMIKVSWNDTKRVLRYI